MESASAWSISYNQFKPAKEGLSEALCTLGNGYFATRGAIPEAMASDVHYPGTYIAGVYNRLPTHIAGRTVFNEDLVNCPNWIFLTFKLGNGEWFYPSASGILSYQQKLDMRKGVLSRRIRFKNRRGLKTLIETDRIVHMADPHFAGMRYVITPENYSGWIKIRTMLDGSVINWGVERYRQLSSKHLRPCCLGSFSRSGIYLSMKTSQSRIEISQAAKIRVFAGQKEVKPAIKCTVREKERIEQEFRIFVKRKQSYRIEKTVSIYTSRDKDVKNPVKSAVDSVQNARRFKTLLVTHQQAWERLWKRFDIKIKGDNFSQKALRLHIFHLLQTVSIHNINIDTGFPARGLHGEAYRGHIFWDVIFTMPFYNLHIPEITKALLLYRYRRLGKAQEAAKKAGYRGAMFPWQSGSSGREETQVIHLNPMSGTWGPDYSYLQRHVSFTVAYNVWRYYNVVGDLDFMVSFGAEMLLSIAQFGASLVKYDSRDGRYHTEGLVGPDEFHENLPGARQPGLRDNAYTNFMIAWTLLKAGEILSVLPENDKAAILKKLKLSREELQRWDDITQKMNIIINKEGIIAQFDGYFGLKELDWQAYIARYGNIQRMDRILKAEGQTPDDYKVSKQADVLMIFYRFELSEVESIFKKLGYGFDRNALKKNYEYYSVRTSHGSTLSKVVHCYISHLLGGIKQSWGWFQQVLEADLYDTQGETTPEGIHTGVMAGSVDIAMRGFAGIHISDDIIRINPSLPESWQRMALRFRCRQGWVSLSITKYEITLLIQGPITRPVKIPVEINKGIRYVSLGKTVKFTLQSK